MPQLLLPLVGGAALMVQVSSCLHLLQGKICCLFLIKADSNKLLSSTGRFSQMYFQRFLFVLIEEQFCMHLGVCSFLNQFAVCSVIQRCLCFCSSKLPFPYSNQRSCYKDKLSAFHRIPAWWALEKVSGHHLVQHPC